MVLEYLKIEFLERKIRISYKGLFCMYSIKIFYKIEKNSGNKEKLIIFLHSDRICKACAVINYINGSHYVLYMYKQIKKII